MLLLMQECRGRFNGKMVKRARFGDVYFDEMGAFLSVDVDRVTGNVSRLSALTPFFLRDLCRMPTDVVFGFCVSCF